MDEDCELKTIRDKIDGVLLLNKPLGLSSNTALQKIKRLFNAQKAGHTGTLDPLATGLLPICFGEATKFSSFLLDGDKEYLATIKLGQATTTYDAEGEITCEHPVTCSTDDILSCLSAFSGQITQIPPIYSALKVNGKALYQYARSGEEVQIKSRVITVHALELTSHEAKNIIQIRVRCSKGTYIRTLAHDIGLTLGCGAHLIALKRTCSNHFQLDENLSLDKLTLLDPSELLKLLLPPDNLVVQLPALNISDDEFLRLKHGHSFAIDAVSGTFKLYYQYRFLGVGVINDNFLHPQRLINTSSL